MSTGVSAVTRTTLADRLVSRSIATDAALVVAGTVFTAIAAQIAVPLWPVPLTFQTFAVLLVGTTLGPLRGVVSMILYLLVGVLGVPVFADGRSGSILPLTTGGYVIGFVLAALLVGWLAQREWDRRFLGTFVAFLAGSVTIYAIGLPWLFVALVRLGPTVWRDNLGYDSVLAATVGAGMIPFLVGDALKALLAAAVLPLAWRAVGHLSRGGAR